MYKGKFDFHDIVIVSSSKESLKKFNGRKGIIRGISQGEDKPSVFAYSVDILNQNNEAEVCAFIFEEELISTGKQASKDRELYFNSIKVRVNPKTGEGEIIDEE